MWDEKQRKYSSGEDLDWGITAMQIVCKLGIASPPKANRNDEY